MKRALQLLLWLPLLAACASAPPVTPIALGEKVNFARLKDQFGNPFENPGAIEYLVFSDEMESSRAARNSFQQVDSVCYESGRLVFVSNVSGMPRLITKLVAVPKMRKYGFPVWLDYDGEATEALPVKEDHVSVIYVHNSHVTQIHFVKEEQALQNKLIALCGAAR